MSLRYKGGVISATPPTLTSNSASGLWTLEQQMQARASGNWPLPPSNFATYYAANLGNSTLYEYATSQNLYSDGSNVLTWNDSSGAKTVSGFLKTNALNNQTLLNKTISLTSFGLWLTSAYQLSDGSILLCGAQESNNYQPFVAKYDSTLTTLAWAYRYGSSNWGLSYWNTTTYIAGVDSSDNIYVQSTADSSGGFTNVITFKLNSSGTPQWAYKWLYGLYNPTSLNTGKANIVDGFSVRGVYTALTGGRNYWTTQFTDNSGNITASVGGYGPGGEYSACFDATLENVSSTPKVYAVGYYVDTSPSNAQFATLVQFANMNGSVNWQKRWQNPTGSNSTFNQVLLDSAGYIWCIGRAESVNKTIICKFDSSGNLIFQRYITQSTGTYYTDNNGGLWPFPLWIADDPVNDRIIITSSKYENPNYLSFSLSIPRDGTILGTGSYTVPSSVNGSATFTYEVANGTIATARISFGNQSGSSQTFTLSGTSITPTINNASTSYVTVGI